MQYTRTKWADYVIVAVRYNSQNKLNRHITDVEVKTHDGQYLSNSKYWTREEVVKQLQFWQRTFVTAINQNGVWHKGEDVRVITNNGVKYIRTDNNGTAADNLGSLPEF